MTLAISLLSVLAVLGTIAAMLRSSKRKALEDLDRKARESHVAARLRAAEREANERHQEDLRDIANMSHDDLNKRIIKLFSKTEGRRNPRK